MKSILRDLSYLSFEKHYIPAGAAVIALGLPVAFNFGTLAGVMTGFGAFAGVIYLGWRSVRSKSTGAS